MAFVFITQQDLDHHIRAEVMDQISESDILRQEDAELWSITHAQSYLRGRYDVDAIFAAVGDARNKIIVGAVVDCMIHHLYKAVSAHQIPIDVVEGCQNSTKALDMLRKGDLNADLPIRPDIDEVNESTLNSRPKFGSYF